MEVYNRTASAVISGGKLGSETMLGGKSPPKKSGGRGQHVSPAHTFAHACAPTAPMGPLAARWKDD